MNQTFQKIVGGVLAVTALMGLSACGSKTEDNKAEGKTYKVGIVQFVDDASLNQIEAAIEAELDANHGLGVTLTTRYNGQATPRRSTRSCRYRCNHRPDRDPGREDH
ncbi:MAG: hypothetical protein ACLTG4_02240 [Oscillospiraceae bacterium]